MKRRQIVKRHAAILMADVVGYSRLMAEDELATHNSVANIHKFLLEPTVLEHQGRIVRLMGDGTLAEFSSALSAASCAVIIQQALNSLEVPPTNLISLRIGIHFDEIIVDGDQIYGSGVNLAKRLEEIAEPGSIVVSDAVHQILEDKSTIASIPMGLMLLKNFVDPVPAYKISVNKNGSYLIDDLENAISHRSFVALTHRLEQSRLPSEYKTASVAKHNKLANYKEIDKTSNSQFDSNFAHDRSFDRPAVTLMPIVNIGKNEDDDYLCFMLGEELLSSVAAIREIHVLSRNATATILSQPKHLNRSHEMYPADYILQGSLRRSESALTMHVYLSECGSGRIAWTKTWTTEEHRLADVICDIIDELRSELLPAVEQDRNSLLRYSKTEILRAYDYYAKGKCIFQNPQTRPHVKRAVDYFEKAIEIDPHFAPAYVQLIRLYNTNFAFTEAGRMLKERRAHAFKLARHLLSLEFTSPNSHIALAWCYMWHANFKSALTHFDEALRLNPYEPDRINAIATGLMYLNDLDRALKLLMRANRLTPFRQDYFNTDFGQLYFLSGDYRKAIDHLTTGGERTMRRAAWRAASYALVGDIENAEKDAAEFLDDVRRVWLGSPGAGPREYIEWFLNFCPFRSIDQQSLFSEALSAASHMQV